MSTNSVWFVSRMFALSILCLFFCHCLNNSNITNSSNINTTNTSGHSHLVGNLRPIRTDSPLLVTSMSRVKSAIESTAFPSSPFVHRLANILQAYSQVVSGVKYYVIFEMTELKSCLKSSEVTCSYESDRISTDDHLSCKDEHFICWAIIWVQPWRNFYHLQNISCSDALPVNVTELSML